MTYLIQHAGQQMRELVAPDIQHAQAHIAVYMPGARIVPGSESLSESLRIFVVNGGDPTSITTWDSEIMGFRAIETESAGEETAGKEGK